MSDSDPDQTSDFFSLYLQYTEKTECPTFFHRWTAITCLSAYLGRSIHFQHGHFTLHSNFYTMLLGSPGTKKSSAIKIGTKLLKAAGYNTFAAKKTRQEKFLLDLAEQSEAYGLDGIEISAEDRLLDENLWGSVDEEEMVLTQPPAECFIAADEFNNFIGPGNLDFISILGELWDYEGVYDYKLKNSKSVYIPNPTVSILGGNTSAGFAHAFPVEAIGQGFFSRLIMVYGEPTGVKYTFPPPPDLKLQEEIVKYLHTIKAELSGEVTLTKEAVELLDTIYRKWDGIEDIRFEHYTNRRLTHLLKLCMLVAANKLSQIITVEHVTYANTVLTYTEQLMPKALGEFGKARHSDVTHKVMAALDSAREPIPFQQLWRLVHTDLDSRNQLVEIICNLQVADKIQLIKREGMGDGYLPKKKIFNDLQDGLIDLNLLTKNERGNL